MADQLRPRWPKLGKLMDEAEDDVLAYMAFPAAHRTKLHSTNPIERLNGQIKRRADVVGIFPSEASMIRQIGAVLLKPKDEWQRQHRYMGVRPYTRYSPRRPPTNPCNFHPKPPEPWPPQAHQHFPPRRRT